jgi:hypothetical protein
MSHRLKKRIDLLNAALNPPLPPRVIWVEADPETFEVGVTYVRWRTEEEHRAAVGVAARAVD